MTDEISCSCNRGKTVAMSQTETAGLFSLCFHLFPLLEACQYEQTVSKENEMDTYM
jgi:hypothetical protein